MAGPNSKEAKYRQQLEDAGVWHDAFETAVHDLCILERRKSRAMKAWNETVPKGGTPSIAGDLHDALLELEKEIFRQRERLGLTPSGMRKLKPPEDQVANRLEIAVVIGEEHEPWAK